MSVQESAAGQGGGGTTRPQGRIEAGQSQELGAGAEVQVSRVDAEAGRVVERAPGEGRGIVGAVVESKAGAAADGGA